MFKKDREIKELRKEIENQDIQYTALQQKIGRVERENRKLLEDIEKLTEYKDKYLKRIREMRKKIKELENGKWS